MCAAATPGSTLLANRRFSKLSAVRAAITRSPSGNLSPARISALIDSKSDTNLHGRAWDIADSRVLIMRETDPARKAMLTDRLNARLAQFKRMSGDE